MKRLLATILLVFLSVGILTVYGAGLSTVDDADLSLDENTMCPMVPAKQSDAVVEKQIAVARALKQAGLQVETMRKRQVVIAVYPMSELFAPNAIELLPDAYARLEAVANVIKRNPGNYKVLVAGHSDDTGSEEYVNHLTAYRADAVAAVLQNGAEKVLTYGCGVDTPIVHNDSREHRARNRRLEIYLVPTEKMIESVKGKRR